MRQIEIGIVSLAAAMKRSRLSATSTPEMRAVVSILGSLLIWLFLIHSSRFLKLDFAPTVLESAQDEVLAGFAH